MAQSTNNNSFAETIPYNFNDVYNDISAKFAASGYDTADGSNISQLVTSMAYTVSMLNANTAMNVNEMILTYANRRENVLATARNLNYEAKHRVSYVYKLDLKSKTGKFIIPKYTIFKQGDTEFVYMGRQLEIFGDANDTISITVKEGKIYQYTDSETLHGFISNIEDSAGNIAPANYVDIPFINVEEDGIEVMCTYMDEYGILHEKEQWTKAESLDIEVDQDPDVKQFFRIDNIEYGTPRIYFRYSGIGRPLQLGTEIFINVLESHGSAGEMDMANVSGIQCANADIYCVGVELISIGADEETADSIKINAPKLYNSSNRLVVAADYASACKRDQRVKNCVVWGGEDEFPKSPGHIWFSFLPPGTHNFTHDETCSKWERDNVSYEWDYSILDKTEQKAKREEFYRLNYVPEASIKSPYRNEDGSVTNHGIWDRLDALKIPTLVYHHRAPLYCEFSYEVEIARYLPYDSKSAMHTDMFNIIDGAFSGTGDTLAYEDFDVEYFNTNIIKRMDERSTDRSGFNVALRTQIVLNEKCLAIENQIPDFRDIYIPLAVPYETYFDKSGFLLVDRLPNIDTYDFVTYLEDGPRGHIFTDWSIIEADIKAGIRQRGHKLIYAPIMVSWSHDHYFADRQIINRAIMPFEIQPDDYSQTGIPNSQYTFDKTSVVLVRIDTVEERTTQELKYGVDWFWDSEEPTIIRLADLNISGRDILRVKTVAQAGWYYLFNTFKKEVMIHLFVDASKKGFVISIGEDQSKDPESELRGHYIYSRDEYYGYSTDDYYFYTRALVTGETNTADQMCDTWALDEASLNNKNSYVDTTDTRPRSYLTTLDGNVLVSSDRWLLTTNGYVVTDESELNNYTGPIVREVNKFMYQRSPLKYDLFHKNRHLDLKYKGNNFAVIRNVIPLLKSVEFYSLSDDGMMPSSNYIHVTLALQGGNIDGETTQQVQKNITWEALSKQLNVPDKNFADFRWWSLESYGESIEPDTTFPIDTTIYAVWKHEAVDLFIDGNGGTVDQNYMNLKAGTNWLDIESEIDALRVNYVMDGLSATPNGERLEGIITRSMTVYVRWALDTSIKVRIVFMGNGGTVDQPELYIALGTQWRAVEATITATRPHYIMDGFSLTPDGEKLDGVVMGPATVYVRWVLDTTAVVRITFIGNGGVVEPSWLDVQIGTKWSEILTRVNGERQDFVLIGFSLTPDGEPLDANSPVMDDVIVYAKWEASSLVQVDFNANGGSPTPPSITIPKGSLWGEVKNQVTDPQKDGYTLKGWRLDLDSYIIKFDANGGSPTPPDLVVFEGTKWGEVKDQVPDPKKKGYTLKGWRIGDGYTITFDANGGHPTPEPLTVPKDSLWRDIKDQVITPVKDGYNLKGWRIGGYIVTFDANGGYPTPEPLTVADGTQWGEVKDLVTTPLKKGFTLRGWRVEEGDFTVTFDANGGYPTPEPLIVADGTQWGEVKGLVTTPLKKGFALKGWHVEEDCTLTFNANGGHPTQEPLTVPKDSLWRDIKDQVVTPLKDGYNLKGWLVNGNYTVTFDANGGYPTPESLTVADGTQWGEVKDQVSDPKKKGFALKGWNVGEDYTVTFDANGGSPTPEPLTVADGTQWGEVKDQVATPLKKGFELNGWNVESEAKTPIDVTNGHTWLKVKKEMGDNVCRISFITNGGTTSQPTIAVIRGTKWGEIKDSIRDAKRSGHKFAGWATGAVQMKDDFVFEKPDVTLHAEWIFDGVTLVFENVEKIPLRIPRGATWGEIKNSILDPVRLNNVFDGWTLGEFGMNLTDDFTFIDSEYTIFAQWKWNGSVLRFDSNGGTPVSDITVLKGTIWGQIKHNVDLTVRSGYTFKWWSLEPNGGQIQDTEVFNDEIEPLFAVWEISGSANRL